MDSPLHDVIPVPNRLIIIISILLVRVCNVYVCVVIKRRDGFAFPPNFPTIFLAFLMLFFFGG